MNANKFEIRMSKTQEDYMGTTSHNKIYSDMNATNIFIN
jgi:hypothetical protein